MYMSSPILDGGFLYGFSNRRKGQLFCLEGATGKVRWTTEGRGGQNASLVSAGQDLVVLTTVRRASPLQGWRRRNLGAADRTEGWRHHPQRRFGVALGAVTSHDPSHLHLVKFEGPDAIQQAEFLFASDELLFKAKPLDGRGPADQ
jgi:hypothetical protein